MRLDAQPLAAPQRVTLRDGRIITIRLIQAADGEALTRFYADIPAKDGIYYLPPSARTRDKALATAQQADTPCKVHLVLADEQGELHGEAWYSWKEAAPEQSTFGICIRRTMQGQGAGRLIMSQLLEVSDRHGPPVMNLTVQKENERAWKLYTSMGFVRLREQMRPVREDAPEMPEFYMERKSGAAR